MIKKRFSLLLIAVILQCCLFAQSEYATIDQASKSVPNQLKTVSDISAHLVQNLSNDEEKLRAIFIWVTHNIKYDTGFDIVNYRYREKDELITHILNKRKGVCEHYCELMKRMCDEVDIQANVIHGYNWLNDGSLSDQSHAWLVAKLKDNYWFFEPTWAAGYAISQTENKHEYREGFFKIAPTEFIKDHMPFDPIWQCLPNPISHSSFSSKDFSRVGEKGNYAFKDSIALANSQDNITYLSHSNRRIQEMGLANEVIKTHLGNQELQMNKNRFNIAVDTINYGINAYNTYIGYKNEQFRKPKISDTEIISLITKADNSIQYALQILLDVESREEEFSQLLEDTRQSTPELAKQIQEEKEFVTKYIKKWKPLRIFMFVQWTP